MLTGQVLNDGNTKKKEDLVARITRTAVTYRLIERLHSEEGTNKKPINTGSPQKLTINPSLAH